MKPVLVTVDSFGESLMQVPGAMATLAAYNLRDNPASWEGLFHYLAKLGVGSDEPDVSLCVIADLGLPECSRILQTLAGHLRERLHCALDHAYVVLPQKVRSDDGAVFELGLPFKRVFILTPGVSSNGEVESASRVLLAHGIPELSAYVYRPGALTTVHSVAWRVSSAGAESESEPDSKGTGGFLKDVIEAVDTLTQDLKGRIDRMLEMVESLDRKEIAIYDKLIPDIHKLVENLRYKEFKPGSIDWGEWFATLPRGLEVKVKLALAVGEAGSRPLQWEELAADLPKPQGDENWNLETEVVAAILHNFVTVENKSWWETIPPVFREQISSNCRRLLRALDSPLIRRRMLESLLYYVLDKHQGNDVKVAVADGVDSVRDELRRHLHQVRGGGIFLILPKSSMEGRRRKELRDWIERVMGSPCEIVLTEGKEAWLYVETPYEGRTAVVQAVPSPAVEKPPLSKVEEMPVEAGKADDSSWTDPEPPPPPPPNARCPDCGAPFSEPRLILPPEQGRTSRNGARPRKTCPTCGRLNAKAWWVCWNHSKAAPIFIAIDKVRCPECILCHHENPEGFPLSKISVRPGYKEPVNCPNCENMRRWDPGHPVFEIPEGLLRFYRDGVNGHDSAHFKTVVRESGLLGDCYCPNCGTLLIPVHHRNQDASLPS